MAGEYASAVGKALEAKCPRCNAGIGEMCVESGQKAPPHVDRGRMARWMKMFPDDGA